MGNKNKDPIELKVAGGVAQRKKRIAENIRPLKPRSGVNKHNIKKYDGNA